MVEYEKEIPSLDDIHKLREQSDSSRGIYTETDPGLIMKGELALAKGATEIVRYKRERKWNTYRAQRKAIIRDRAERIRRRVER